MLQAGAFVAPLVPLMIVSALYRDSMLYRSNLLEVALLWFVGFLVSYALIIVHESGHLLAARVFGIEIESVTIGHWKKLLSFKLSGLANGMNGSNFALCTRT